jgi:hypothetical protein
MELDIQSLFGLLCTRTVVLIGWGLATPPPRIWAHIRGRYWSGKKAGSVTIHAKTTCTLFSRFLHARNVLQTYVHSEQKYPGIVAQNTLSHKWTTIVHLEPLGRILSFSTGQFCHGV